MADESKEAEGAEAPPQGGKNKLVLILVVVNLVVVLAAAGGAVAFVTMGGTGSAAAEAPPEEADAPRSVGPLMEISDIVVNLEDEDSQHFVRAGFQFELSDAERQSDVEAHLVPIRSAFLLHFSGMTVDQTRGREARQQLLDDLKTIANEEIGAELVSHVYFTAFVVQ